MAFSLSVVGPSNFWLGWRRLPPIRWTKRKTRKTSPRANLTASCQSEAAVVFNQDNLGKKAASLACKDEAVVFDLTLRNNRWWREQQLSKWVASSHIEDILLVCVHLYSNIDLFSLMNSVILLSFSNEDKDKDVPEPSSKSQLSL